MTKPRTLPWTPIGTYRNFRHVQTTSYVTVNDLNSRDHVNMSIHRYTWNLKFHNVASGLRSILPGPYSSVCPILVKKWRCFDIPLPKSGTQVMRDIGTCFPCRVMKHSRSIFDEVIVRLYRPITCSVIRALYK